MKLSEMAQALGCTLQGNGNLEIFGVAGIDEAQAGEVTFVSNPKYAAKAKTTSASAVIVSSNFQDIPSVNASHRESLSGFCSRR